MDDLLLGVDTNLKAASALLDELEETIKPVEKEINELLGKIKTMEKFEEIYQQVQFLKKKLAWSWVYDVDRELKEQSEKLIKLRERVPTCQHRIDKKLVSHMFFLSPHTESAGVHHLSKFLLDALQLKFITC